MLYLLFYIIFYCIFVGILTTTFFAMMYNPYHVLAAPAISPNHSLEIINTDATDDWSYALTTDDASNSGPVDQTQQHGTQESDLQEIDTAGSSVITADAALSSLTDASSTPSSQMESSMAICHPCRGSGTYLLHIYFLISIHYSEQ